MFITIRNVDAHFFLYFYVVNFLKDSDRGTNESSNESGQSLQPIKRLTSKVESYPKGKKVILFIPL